jgi:hypothetical protein
MRNSEPEIDADMPGKTGMRLLLAHWGNKKVRSVVGDRSLPEWPGMLTSAPRRAHAFPMFGCKYRAFVLIACFAVTFVAVLAAMTAPASAHVGGPHAIVESASQVAAEGDGPSADTCCHQSGTCVAQVLPVAPITKLLDSAPTALFRHAVAVHAASFVSTTDPPPPRP